MSSLVDQTITTGQLGTKYGLGDVLGMTVMQFAQLPPIWPEAFHIEGAKLVARIHPKHNRSDGDEEVLARALVVQYRDPYSSCELPEGKLSRLTIRTSNLVARGLPEYAGWYRDLLYAVYRLPALELNPPPRPAILRDALDSASADTMDSAR